MRIGWRSKKGKREEEKWSKRGKYGKMMKEGGSTLEENK